MSAVRHCLLTMKILSAAGNLPETRRELKVAEGTPDEFWPSFPTRERQTRVSILISCLWFAITSPILASPFTDKLYPDLHPLSDGTRPADTGITRSCT